MDFKACFVRLERNVCRKYAGSSHQSFNCKVSRGRGGEICVRIAKLPAVKIKPTYICHAGSNHSAFYLLWATSAGMYNNPSWYACASIQSLLVLNIYIAVIIKNYIFNAERIFKLFSRNHHVTAPTLYFFTECYVKLVWYILFLFIFSV